MIRTRLFEELVDLYRQKVHAIFGPAIDEAETAHEMEVVAKFMRDHPEVGRTLRAAQALRTRINRQIERLNRLLPALRMYEGCGSVHFSSGLASFRAGHDLLDPMQFVARAKDGCAELVKQRNDLIDAFKERLLLATDRQASAIFNEQLDEALRIAKGGKS